MNGRYGILYSFFRSKACYDALKNHSENIDFEITRPFTHTQNLFLQDTFLSWCKIFGADSENCHWKKLFNDHSDFRTVLLKELNITENDFKKYWKSVVCFRNQWIVHLDPECKQNPVPEFDIAVKSSKVLFDYLTRNHNQQYKYRGPDSIDSFSEQISKDFLSRLKT